MEMIEGRRIHRFDSWTRGALWEMVERVHSHRESLESDGDGQGIQLNVLYN